MNVSIDVTNIGPLQNISAATQVVGAPWYDKLPNRSWYEVQSAVLPILWPWLMSVNSNTTIWDKGGTLVSLCPSIITNAMALFLRACIAAGHKHRYYVPVCNDFQAQMGTAKGLQQFLQLYGTVPGPTSSCDSRCAHKQGLWATGYTTKIIYVTQQWFWLLTRCSAHYVGVVMSYKFKLLYSIIPNFGSPNVYIWAAATVSFPYIQLIFCWQWSDYLQSLSYLGQGAFLLLGFEFLSKPDEAAEQAAVMGWEEACHLFWVISVVLKHHSSNTDIGFGVPVFPMLLATLLAWVGSLLFVKMKIDGSLLTGLDRWQFTYWTCSSACCSFQKSSASITTY